jgi:uncharacterized protein YkwD
VLTGKPPKASQPAGSEPAPTRSRRAWLLLAVPPLVAALVAGGLDLTRGPAPAPSRLATAPSRLATASPSALASPAPVASPVPGACTSAAAGSCTQPPFHVSTARVPRSPARTRSTASSPAASSSARATRPASSSAPPASARSATSPAASRPASASSALPAQQGTPAGQVLAVINQARSAAGLPPLTVTAGLESSASAHNLRMADGCGLTHQCPGEPAIGARETAAGVNWTAAGENIGEGGPEPDTTSATAQMAVTLTRDMLAEKPPDDGHRLNILSSTFTHIGIAVYRDRSGTVWMTQDFSN